MYNANMYTFKNTIMRISLSVEWKGAIKCKNTLLTHTASSYILSTDPIGNGTPVLTQREHMGQPILLFCICNVYYNFSICLAFNVTNSITCIYLIHIINVNTYVYKNYCLMLT